MQGQNTIFGEGALAFFWGKNSAIFAYLGKMDFLLNQKGKIIWKKEETT